MRLVALILTLGLLSPILCEVEVSEQAKEVDLLQLQIDEIKSQIVEYYKNLDKRIDGYSKSFEKLMQTNSFVCTGGQDPSKMTKKAYLDAFAKSKCAPMMAIPGASMSKLIIEIDCPTLKSQDPATFAVCGWKDCTGSSAPKAEYLAWIPEVSSPISLLKPNDNTRTCFTNLLGFTLSGTGRSIQALDHVGVTSRVLGESSATRTTSQCGYEACSDLVPAEFQTKDLRYFQHWKQLFEAAGYVNGLTFQTMPYDWRKDLRENNSPRKLPQIIDGLFQATGKRVVIAAHSYGNFQALSNIYNISTADKQLKIGRYISIAPPFLGSAIALQQELGMDSSYEFNLVFVKLGLTPKMFKGTIANFPAAFNLMPSDFFQRYADTDWMKAIKQRLGEEQQKKPITKGTIMDVFPTNDHTCRSAETASKARGTKCVTGLYIPETYGKVINDPISLGNIPTILSRYSFNNKIQSLYMKYAFNQPQSFEEDKVAESNDFVFPTFPNPEIPITFLYVNALETHTSIFYKNDPSTKTKKDEFYPPDSFGDNFGDTTIDTGSSITAGVKWAHEYKIQKLQNSQPIGFGEICGSYNRQAEAPLGGDYFGIDCECHSHGSGCDHAGIMVDEKLIEFVFNTAKRGEDGAQGGKGVQPKFQNMTEQQLQSYVTNCDLWF